MGRKGDYSVNWQGYGELKQGTWGALWLVFVRRQTFGPYQAWKKRGY
jgi:hypothetical protein